MGLVGNDKGSEGTEDTVTSIFRFERLWSCDLLNLDIFLGDVVKEEPVLVAPRFLGSGTESACSPRGLPTTPHCMEQS